MFIIEKEEFRYIDTDSKDVISCLEPGLYNTKIRRSFFGSSLSLIKNTSHTKGNLAEAGVFKEVKEYLNDYYSEAAKLTREEMNLPSRLGMLFKGNPGTGKTFMACKLAQYLVETQNAIAIVTSQVSDLQLPETVDILRKNTSDPNRLIILIWDEFEKDWNNCNQINILSFLDGTNSRDNVLVIATVNNIKKLPDTLLDRPGRFELVKEFSIQNEEIATNIITAMIPVKHRNSINSTELYNTIIKEVGNKFTIDNIKVYVRNKVTEIIKQELLT